METDALIQTLARDPRVKGPPMQAWLAISIAGALAYSVLAILILAGVPPRFHGRRVVGSRKSRTVPAVCTGSSAIAAQAGSAGPGGGRFMPAVGRAPDRLRDDGRRIAGEHG